MEGQLLQENKLNRAKSTLFLAGVTFLGGYLDTYTYITRGGVFANNHTVNMAKLGIMLAQGNFPGALKCFGLIFSCALGAFVSEFTKSFVKADWQSRALLMEAAALLMAGFIPSSAADVIVTMLFAFITGFQLCIFRNSEWGPHNTTICTGNLRSVGQYAYGAVSQKTPEAKSRSLKYTLLVFSFTVGAGVGVPICNLLGCKASWIGCLIALGLMFAL